MKNTGWLACRAPLPAALRRTRGGRRRRRREGPVAKYSKLPTFEPPGPAFDAKNCMEDKKIFVIPLTDDNPFKSRFSAAWSRRPRWSASTSGPGRPSSRPTNGPRASTRPSRSDYNLIDLAGGLPPEFIAPQIAEARGKGVKVDDDPRLRPSPRTPPDFLDGSGNTDYVTVGKIIAAWTIAKTGRQGERVGSRTGRDHADDAAEEASPRLFQGELPVLQDHLTSTRRRPNGRPRSSQRCRPRCSPIPRSTTSCRSTTRCRNSSRRRLSRRESQGQDRLLQWDALRARHDA